MESHIAPRRRVVRRRGALDRSWDNALAELPPDLRPLVRQYVENMQAGMAIRSELTRVMPQNGMRWSDVDRVASSLAYAA